MPRASGADRQNRPKGDTVMTNTSGARLEPDMQECAKNCADCQRVCIETASHCLALGGRHAEPRHIELLLDCADICEVSLRFLARSSEYHHDTCSVCSEICRDCAESCEQITMDAMMKECADACRRCAESCDRMARKAA